MSFIGICILAIGLFFLRTSWPLWILIGLLSLATAGIGISLPCLDALITEGIDKEKRGTISSIYSSMRFIGVATGPPLVALLMKWAENWIFIGLAVISILSGLVNLFWIRPEKKEDPAPEKGTLFVRIR